MARDARETRKERLVMRRSNPQRRANHREQENDEMFLSVHDSRVIDDQVTAAGGAGGVAGAGEVYAE